jgi:hypothetical protein
MLSHTPNCLAFLHGKGLNVYLRGQKLAVSPGSAITNEVRAWIQENRDPLIQSLESLDSTPDLHQPLVSVELGETTYVAYRYSPSDPPILGGLICLDCETAEIREGEGPPPIALVSASDGRYHFLIQPDDLALFVKMYRDRHIVFHNSAFDFGVIEAHLSGLDPSTLEIWINMARGGQFHDTMLLDMLLRIATSGTSESTRPRALDKVAREYTQISVDKECPFRRRYAEIIGVSWSDVETGFFEYAIKDAIATVQAYVAMHGKAVDLMRQAGFDETASRPCYISPEAIEHFGPLTEQLQTKAAIALAAVARRGMVTDQHAVKRLHKKWRAQLNNLIKEIHQSWPGIFHLKNGVFKLTEKSQRPSENQRVLRETLEKALQHAGVDEQTWPRDQKGLISLKAEDWQGLRSQAGFVDTWFRYKSVARSIETLRPFQQSVIRPEYHALQITGRTACSKPNMQNVPRNQEFRQLIVPSEGHFLMTIDYSFIELVTLAATLLCRYGASKLAEVIGSGVDPHCHTAAMLMGLSSEEFLELKSEDPDRFREWRSWAKPINFGVPGGMSASSLVSYAQTSYGVQLSLDQAIEFRRKLIEDVYPELSRYLKEDEMMDALAQNLGVPVEALWGKLDFTGDRPDWFPKTVFRALSGETKSDGTPFSPKLLGRIWDGLNTLNSNPEISQIISERTASPETVKQLFPVSAAATLTGRLRANVRYTTRRNTPFQGLAADGAKVALAELVFRGFRVIGFVHDEFLVELPDQGGYSCCRQFQEVVAIVRESMERVTEGIPVKCEASLATCWAKNAKLYVEGDRVFPWSPEKEGP